MRKPSTLKRLVRLYGIVEEIHSVELRRTTTAVHEVDAAIGSVRQVATNANAEVREALTNGDLIKRATGETEYENAAQRRLRLDALRVEREALNNAASAQYVASRTKTEQMKTLADSFAAKYEAQESRRTQAVSDDRYLARQRWRDTTLKRQQDASR